MISLNNKKEVPKSIVISTKPNAKDLCPLAKIRESDNYKNRKENF
jgi:hypothetical protein